VDDDHILSFHLHSFNSVHTAEIYTIYLALLIRQQLQRCYLLCTDSPWAHAGPSDSFGDSASIVPPPQGREVRPARGRAREKRHADFVVAGIVIVMILIVSCSFKQAQIASDADAPLSPQTHKPYISYPSICQFSLTLQMAVVSMCIVRFNVE
jgi:hypothetical protein